MGSRGLSRELSDAGLNRMLERNTRMVRAVRGLDRLADLDELLAQQARVGDEAP